MTTLIAKKIGANLCMFFVFLIISAILAPILSVIFGILSAVTFPMMFILFLFPKGKKWLAKRVKWVKQLKIWQVICLLPIYTVVFSTPTLFALSLILHWHLASTIFCGIMASLLVIFIAALFVLWFGPFGPDEESEKKNDLSISTETEVIQQKQVDKNINEHKFHPKGEDKQTNEFTKII